MRGYGKATLGILVVAGGLFGSIAGDLQSANGAEPPKEPVLAPVWKVGDSWTFVNADKKEWTQTIVRIEDGLYVMQTTDPRLKDRDYYWNANLRTVKIIGRSDNTQIREPGWDWQWYSFPVSVGKSWSFTGTSQAWTGVFVNYQNDVRVLAFEEVKTAAGILPAFKLEHIQINLGQRWTGTSHYWYSPVAKRNIKWQCAYPVHSAGFSCNYTGPGERPWAL